MKKTKSAAEGKWTNLSGKRIFFKVLPLTESSRLQAGFVREFIENANIIGVDLNEGVSVTEYYQLCDIVIFHVQ